MKTSSTNTTFVFFALFFLLQACSKKTENMAPVVTLSMPMLNDTFKSGSDIHFQGTAADDNALHEGKLQLLRAADDSVLTQLSVSVHGLKTYRFDERITLQTAVAVAAKARVTFSDHDDAITMKEVAVQLLP